MVDSLGTSFEVYGILTCRVKAFLPYAYPLVGGFILFFCSRKKVFISDGRILPILFFMPRVIYLGELFFGGWQPSSLIGSRVRHF